MLPRKGLRRGAGVTVDGQLAAVLEGVVVDIGDAGGDGDLCQGGAAREGALFDPGQPGREDNLRQTIAEAESGFTNCAAGRR